VRCRTRNGNVYIVNNETETFMANVDTPRHRREQVSARLDPDVIAVVETVAEHERRPVSAVVRNVLTDWAAWKKQHQQAPGEVAA
jgi:hypothetical protein